MQNQRTYERGGEPECGFFLSEFTTISKKSLPQSFSLGTVGIVNTHLCDGSLTYLYTDIYSKMTIKKMHTFYCDHQKTILQVFKQVGIKRNNSPHSTTLITIIK